MSAHDRGLVWYLKQMPLVVAFVEVRDGKVIPYASNYGPLLDEELKPTPNWVRFNLEDYDAMLESLAAAEDELATKPPTFCFRFDMRVLRNSR